MPILAPRAPAHGLAQRLASLALRLTRWRVVGVMPRAPKLVTIVAPHTSNWDFLVGL
ncbi:MAG: glycerol acyltransferase, partial [Acidimicrobiales bacterium]